MTNIFIYTGQMMTNTWVYFPTFATTNVVLTNIGLEGIEENFPAKSETKVFTITNYVTVAVPAAPSKPIQIPTTTVIGVVICVLCFWRLWIIRKADQKLKQIRESAYKSYMSAQSHTYQL